MRRIIRLFKFIALIFVFSLLCSDVSAFLVTKTSTGAEIKWYDTSSAAYYINTAGGPSNTLSAVQSGMQTWTGVGTSCFNFIYGGATASTAHGIDDANNIVTFAPMGLTGTLAENVFWYFVSSGQMIDSDLRFNTSYAWSTTVSSGAYDVQALATHEFGHSLSLSDLYSPADSEKTMYGSAAAEETKKRTLHQDDIDGITYLYTCTATLPVYRFNTGLGSHFYTMSEAEKDYVLNNLPHYILEGIAYYAFGQQEAGTLPVYRFNTGLGSHFYTISEAEKDYVLNNLPHYILEGVVFYTYTQPQ